MSHSRLLACVAVALLLGGCTKDQAPPLPSIAGTWQGTVVSQTLRMTVTEDGGSNVSGSATLSRADGPSALTVSGTFISGRFVGTFASGIRNPFNVEATLSADRNALIGTVNGSGFLNDPLSLQRQP